MRPPDAVSVATGCKVLQEQQLVPAILQDTAAVTRVAIVPLLDAVSAATEHAGRSFQLLGNIVLQT